MQFVKIHQERGVTIVEPQPGFDRAFIDFSGFDELAETIEPPKMILDLKSGIDIGSAFLALLSSLKFALEERRGGQFALCTTSSNCREFIECIKRERKPRFFETQEDAIEAFGE